jgi:predicted component of type VI protein secretion system
MPAQLVSLDDGMRILLDKPILLVGRDSECDIQFESKKISRRHCCIAQVGKRLIVRDLGSTNGIRINGVRVVEGFLRDSDELSFGSLRYRVVGDELAAGPAGGIDPPRKKKRAKETPPPAINDDLLESSDEPIALSDPLSPKSRTDPKNRGADRVPEKRATDTTPGILPEHLDLAPSSDISLPSPPADAPP